MYDEVLVSNSQLLRLTQEAQDHFTTLLANEAANEANAAELNLRITVVNPGTLKADVGITYCPVGNEQENDLLVEYPNFNIYIEQNAVSALQEAVIDYKKNRTGGQLSIKAPYIRGKAPAADASLTEKVQYIIESEINPGLASHGGFVRLVEVTAEQVVILSFGGGCHGCGMADVTLKSGIEKTLLKHCPEIKAVQDITDHAAGKNPYYK